MGIDISYKKSMQLYKIVLKICKVPTKASWNTMPNVKKISRNYWCTVQLANDKVKTTEAKKDR